MPFPVAGGNIAKLAYDNADEAKQTANSVRDEFDRVVAEAGSNNPEIVLARGTAASLKERLDSNDAILAERVNVVSSLTPLGKTRYIGHRGISRLAPESTQASFELVAEYGLWGCEFDVQLTSDGVWVVIHDLTVDALTNGTGAVSGLSLTQIKALVVDAGSNVTKYPNQKILTFEEAITICRKLNVTPVLEIKSIYTSGQLDTLISIIRKNGIEDKCFIEGDRQICNDVRSRSKLIGLMMFAGSEDLTYIPELGNALLNTNYNNIASKDFVDYMHSLGVLVNVFTVNSYDDARKLEKWGVDFIMTDSLVGGVY